MTKCRIVARNQEELSKFGETIGYGLELGSTVNPYEVVKMTHQGNILNLEEAVYDYNSRFPFLEEPIQLLPIDNHPLV